MAELGMKFDGEKSRVDLIPWDSVESYHGLSLETTVLELKAWWITPNMKWLGGIPTNMVLGVGHVLGFGARKYAPRNWEKGLLFSKIFGAALRHAYAIAAGELIDPESGMPHEWHFWCEVMFLGALTARGRTDLDDRPRPTEDS